MLAMSSLFSGGLETLFCERAVPARSEMGNARAAGARCRRYPTQRKSQDSMLRPETTCPQTRTMSVFTRRSLDAKSGVESTAEFLRTHDAARWWHRTCSAAGRAPTPGAMPADARRIGTHAFTAGV
jgi:hypothetical protein